MRDAVYVTYNNANGEEETVENRAASADCETLYDYFYDSCQSRKNLSASAVAHDYSQHTVIDLPGGGTKRVMTQAANGWKWVWVLDANGAVIDTTAQTVAECASSALYHRQAFCRNLTDGQLPEGAKESTCPTDRTW
ncbi:MAG: hypothetical protein OXC55_03860 [Chloroflexi bacterium]|nr:hypothetical protein [Chloroflexota bacterium]